MKKPAKVFGVPLLCTLVAAAAGCGSSHTGSAGGATSTPGVTANAITVGLVTSQTGPAAANFYGNAQGAEARVDLQNAEGGVNGRQLKLDIADDTSSTQGGQIAVSDLVQQKGVFGLIFLSDFVSVGYRVAQQAAVPVVGAAIDGPEWGTQPNTNMVSTRGNMSPVPVPNDLEAKVAKLAGATNMAAFGIGGEEPSILAAKAFVTSAKSIGLNVGYENYSIPVGTVDVTAIVLAMKQQHIDGFASYMLDTTDFAIISGARQAGFNLVAPISATGYGQQLLDQPSAVQAAQGAIFGVGQVPVSENTSATKTEQAAFAKYEHFAGVPSLSWSSGWESADLFIRGLQTAGKNFTRGTFLDGLHHLKGWTAGGLLASSPDLSLANFGKSPDTQCQYYARLTGNTFVPLNDGKPICGTNVSS